MVSSNSSDSSYSEEDAVTSPTDAEAPESSSFVRCSSSSGAIFSSLEDAMVMGFVKGRLLDTLRYRLALKR